MTLRGALLVALTVAGAWSMLRLRRARDTARERMRRDQRLASLGRLAASIAHEVRNPLNAIGIGVQRIERELEPSPKARHLTGVVVEEIDRLNRTVIDVLRYARPAEPKLSPIEGGALLDSVALLAGPEAEAEGVRLHFMPSGVPEFQGDIDLLKGAIWNLLRNAISVSPSGKTVTLALNRRGARVEIEVRDGGPGIPASARNRLFEPFESPSQEGSGLGLHLALSAAQAHGGSIEVRDNPDGGAVFVMSLPMENN